MDALSVVLMVPGLLALVWLIVLGFLWSTPLPLRPASRGMVKPLDSGIEHAYVPPVSPEAQLARRLVALELAELARLADLQRRAEARLRAAGR